MKLDLKTLKNIIVLYIEDEELIRTQTSSIFQNLFKKVLVAKDGEQGLELYAKNADEIDVIVSDINMPGINGLELAEKVHLDNKKMPIILTTAFADEEYLLKSFELNINKYVTKPLKIKELANTIADVVKKYRQKEDLVKATKALADKNIEVTKEIDILEQNQALIKQELEFKKTIVDNYVSSFQTDKNGIIRKVSTKFCRLFKYNKNDIIGQATNIISSNPSELQKLMLETIREKKPRESLQKFISADGKEFEANVTVFPMFGEDTLISGYKFYQDLV